MLTKVDFAGFRSFFDALLFKESDAQVQVRALPSLDLL